MNASASSASSPSATASSVAAAARPLASLVVGLLGCLAAVLLALHYLHLSADFPAHTPWMDWAKYTDEGWYGDAAIRLFTTGHWFVPGDFNPAVALPVWPILLGLAFRVTGVSLVAARALSVSVFAAAALVLAILVRRALTALATSRSPAQPQTAAPSIAAAFLLFVLSGSPFLFAFSRMAVLEPLVVLLGLLALLAASPAMPTITSRQHSQLSIGTDQGLRPAVLVGLLLPLMVLTKTTALFLTPSVFWMLWARAGYRIRPALPLFATALSLAGSLWLLYFGLIVHPHFLADYRYLFSVNGYTGITPDTARQLLIDTVRFGRWISPVFAPAALLAAVVGLFLRPLRHQPLFVSLLLWIAGYASFLAYHANLQPRYYLVLAAPLLALLPLTLGSLWITDATRPHPSQAIRVAILAASALLTLAVFREAATTVRYARSPTYSFLSAARQIHKLITADQHHSQLLLSISGSDISLMTGLHSICDDFGTLELDDRLELYKPGWYATWNQVEDDKMDALTPLFHLERVAAFPAYDDPERNLLILYRLESAGEHRAERRRRARARLIPRRLQIHNGQQPSPNQLEH